MYVCVTLNRDFKSKLEYSTTYIFGCLLYACICSTSLFHSTSFTSLLLYVLLVVAFVIYACYAHLLQSAAVTRVHYQ